MEKYSELIRLDYCCGSLYHVVDIESTAIVIGVINISAQPPSLPEIGADIIQNQAFRYYNYDIKSELEKISNVQA